MSPAQLGTWPRLGLLSGAAALALSVSFFLTPLVPWPDQGATLQAAISHAAGRGLTVTELNSDLARPARRWLTYFPPLYPLLVSGLLQLGASLALAVKACNAAAVLAGCLAWSRLAAGSLDGRARLVFTGLLVLTGGALVPRGGTTDMILWAGLPVWMLLLLRGCRERRLAPAAAWLAAASIIAGVLIGVRWAAAFLVISGCLHVMVEGAPTGAGRRLVLAVAHGGPATLAYASYGAFNRALGGEAANYLDYIQPRWDWSRLASVYPLEALTTIPLGLEPLLRRAWRTLDPDLSSEPLGLALRLALPALALWWLGRRAARRQVTPSGRLSACTCLTLVAFLAFMTVRFNWEGSTWSYLTEPRYFRPVGPAALLLWLFWLERLPPVRRQMAHAVLGVAALYLFQAHVRWERERLRPQESWELTAQVLERTQAPGLHVVLDNDVSTYVQPGREALVLAGYPDEASVATLQASQPVELWVVWRPHEPTVYLLDQDRDRRRVEALRKRFGLVLTWRSPRGSYDLLHASLSSQVTPGPVARQNSGPRPTR